MAWRKSAIQLLILAAITRSVFTKRIGLISSSDVILIFPSCWRTVILELCVCLYLCEFCLLKPLLRYYSTKMTNNRIDYKRRRKKRRNRKRGGGGGRSRNNGLFAFAKWWAGSRTGVLGSCPLTPPLKAFLCSPGPHRVLMFQFRFKHSFQVLKFRKSSFLDPTLVLIPSKKYHLMTKQNKECILSLPSLFQNP